jgi:hypothetical protein
MLNHKNCPQCGGVLLLEAIVCLHCTHHFSAEEMAWARRKARINFWLKLGAGHFLFALVIAAAFSFGRMKAQDEKANRRSDATETSAAPGLAPPPALVEPISRPLNAEALEGPDSSAAAAPPAAQTGPSTAAVLAAISALPYLSTPSANRAQGGWFEQDVGDGDVGGSAHVSVLESANRVQLPFPFEGGVRGELILRTRGPNDRVLLFRVERGPIWCSPDDPKHWIRVEIDGTWKSYACRDPGDSDGSYAFFKAPEPLLALLRQGKSFTVEVQFYDADPQRFLFTSARLQRGANSQSPAARG